MQDSMIARVLLVSPEQNELYKRNKSRIFIGVEGESLIDTILQQPARSIEEYISAAERAIAMSGLSDDYGDLRPIYGSQIGAAGATHLVSTRWLKNEGGDVYDMFISMDPDYEPSSAPPVTFLNAADINGSIDGESPLILMADISDLTGSPEDHYDSDNETGEYRNEPDTQQPDDNVQFETSDGPVSFKANTNNQGGDNTGQTGNGQHSPMSSNEGEIAERRSTNTGGHAEENGAQPAPSQTSGSNNSQPSSQGRNAPDVSDEPQPGGQGRVKSPDDGRLKANRDQGTHIDGTNNASNSEAEVGGQGRVKDPNDGRLKANIDNGTHIDDAKSADARQPEMARKSQEVTGDAPRRGRVTGTFDRRLKANRGPRPTRK